MGLTAKWQWLHSLSLCVYPDLSGLSPQPRSCRQETQIRHQESGSHVPAWAAGQGSHREDGLQPLAAIRLLPEENPRVGLHLWPLSDCCWGSEALFWDHVGFSGSAQNKVRLSLLSYGCSLHILDNLKNAGCSVRKSLCQASGCETKLLLGLQIVASF